MVFGVQVVFIYIYIPNDFVQIKYKLHLRCHFKTVAGSLIAAVLAQLFGLFTAQRNQEPIHVLLHRELLLTLLACVGEGGEGLLTVVVLARVEVALLPADLQEGGDGDVRWTLR